jgi:hypothetical protein
LKGAIDLQVHEGVEGTAVGGGVSGRSSFEIAAKTLPSLPHACRLKKHAIGQTPRNVHQLTTAEGSVCSETSVRCAWHGTARFYRGNGLPTMTRAGSIKIRTVIGSPLISLRRMRLTSRTAT